MSATLTCDLEGGIVALCLSMHVTCQAKVNASVALLLVVHHFEYEEITIVEVDMIGRLANQLVVAVPKKS